MQDPTDIQEIPTPNNSPSTLSIFDKTLSWQTSAGIYTGTLISGDDTCLEKINIIPYPTHDQILGLSTTVYHYMVLAKSGLYIQNRLDPSKTEFIKLPPDEILVSINHDKSKNTYWLSTRKSLYEVIVEDEERDMWKIYFDRKEYQEALRVARGGVKRMVAERYAQVVFGEEKYELAAGD
jgi:vacuolar protein sorting-associated protein 18